MLPLLIILGGLAGFALLSLLSVYSYGRFTRRWQGEPSVSLSASASETPLDNLIEPLTRQHKDQSGLMLLDSNLDAFAVRALTARQAGRSLDLQYYIWKGDLTGRLLANELLMAADRGVRVRLLLDDLNMQKHDRTLLSLDAHHNIEVRLFNPSRNRDGALRRGIEMLLRAFSITRRMHNKAWIADGRVAVVGGRNVGDAYFDAAARANFRDLDLLVVGDAVGHAESIFDRYWNSGSVIPIGALRRMDTADLAGLRMNSADLMDSGHARPYRDRVRENAVRGILAGTHHMHWTSTARIVSDPPEKMTGASDHAWLMTIIRPMLSATASDLKIISPYFVPGKGGTEFLADMTRRGVRVGILTNSLAATDVVAVHGAYARYRRALIASGVRLFELKPFDDGSDSSLFGSSGASLHTKAFTIDDNSGFIGSLNFDPRSVSLNTEMGVFFEHAGLVAEVGRIFSEQTSPASSYRVRKDGDDIIWEHGTADAPRIVRAEPEASFPRRLSATIIGLLPFESQL